MKKEVCYLNNHLCDNFYNFVRFFLDHFLKNCLKILKHSFLTHTTIHVGYSHFMCLNNTCHLFVKENKILVTSSIDKINTRVTCFSSSKTIGLKNQCSVEVVSKSKKENNKKN